MISSFLNDLLNLNPIYDNKKKTDFTTRLAQITLNADDFTFLRPPF